MTGSTRPVLLDGCCKAGGAATGYHQAGWQVIGVDSEPQPRYPYQFIQADILSVLAALGDVPGGPVRAIHVSPPCQEYSCTKNMPGPKKTYPRLIGPVRDLCRASGLPYVIENVEGSALVRPVRLCGSMFGMTWAWKGLPVYLQRHRLFESSFSLGPPGPCDHRIGVRAVTVAGHGRFGTRGGNDLFTGPGFEQLKRDIMGIHWMNRDELGESIPPAYTRHVGRVMLEAL